MLPRARTIKTHDFDLIKKKGKLFQSEDFGVAILNRRDKEKSRFGFVISTKISKLAVHRNRVRRALSEAVRRNMNDVPEGYDMIFLVKKSITKKTTAEIMRQVNSFLKTTKFPK